LDPEIWKVSFPQYQPGDSDPLIIGYMGGDSHYPDLEMIAPVLEGILNSYGQRICFQFWGVEPPLDHQKWENVAWTRLQDPDYRRFSAYFIEQNCDIFVAPLKNNLFNQSKSPVKYFEYSILGMPGVYSWIRPYEEVISHGRNGFLAETMSDWESCLISLIEDETLRTQMGNAARSDVRQNWLISDHADLWINTYKTIIADGKGSKKRLFPTDVIRSIGSQNKSWQNELLNP
jgi:glycosyltransferase involved in cell wall biosynthesis